MAVKLNIRKVISAAFWSVAGAGVLVLLVAAIRYRNSNVCKGYRIEIAAATPADALFIDKKGIADILTAAGATKGRNKPIQSFDLRRLESALGKNVWIKEAQLFFDNNGILQVKVVEREPIARIFTREGNSCYVDSSGVQLPLTDKLPARLPVFTGYPGQKIMLHGSDSALTMDILHLSAFIRRDPFWTAQIAQVAITSGNTFQLEPETGSHHISFGDGSDIASKFHRLYLFYTEVLARTAPDKYDRIDISFAGQVVATKRGSEHDRYDSVQGLNNIRQMIRSAQQLQPDTIRQKNIRPLEHNAMTEQNLTPLDLVPDAGDSIAKPPNKP
jgi:cell division protein FtsQ